MPKDYFVSCDRISCTHESLLADRLDSISRRHRHPHHRRRSHHRAVLIQSVSRRRRRHPRDSRLDW